MFKPSLFSLLFVIVASALSCSHPTPPANQVSYLVVSTPEVRATPIPPTEETAIAGRDLSRYDFGGRLGCTRPFPSNSRRCKSSLQQARKFIWKHWQEKTRGYIIVKRASVDAGSNAHIFIEPDDDGAWQIVWREELVYAASVPSAIPGTIDQLTEIRSVKHKRATETDDWPPGTSFLIFLDKTGERIESL
jgi:hypothetical protein